MRNIARLSSACCIVVVDEQYRRRGGASKLLHEIRNCSDLYCMGVVKEVEGRQFYDREETFANLYRKLSGGASRLYKMLA